MTREKTEMTYRTKIIRFLCIAAISAAGELTAMERQTLDGLWDFRFEERKSLEEVFAMKELCGIAIWQFTDAKTYTRTMGMVGRSYGVNTGGLYDLYRRPKLVVESVRELFRKGPVR